MRFAVTSANAICAGDAIDLESRTISRQLATLPLPDRLRVAYLDRVNVGFASLTMNEDVGVSRPLTDSAPASFLVYRTCFWRNSAPLPACADQAQEFLYAARVKCGS